jgi:hypothetical protein
VAINSQTLRRYEPKTEMPSKEVSASKHEMEEHMH